MDRTRQVALTIDLIRPDHLLRYGLAALTIPEGSRVLDIACGVGYGSWLMAHAGLDVTGVDISQEAIDYANEHYKGPTYLCQKAEETKGNWDAIVTFETLEHVRDPEVVLANVRAPLLIASVPNEEVFKFASERFVGDEYPHLRHYTPAEFEDLLNRMGYEVQERLCQKDKQGKITPGTDGRFLIYVANGKAS